jgi:radical SAM superfamily enzyme YgiQ (UPF0313 family)
MVKNIYFCQINNSFNGDAFLPYSTAALWSYARSHQDIAQSYHCGSMLFLREPVQYAVQRLHQPDVLAVSCYLWNWNYSMQLIAAAKKQWPQLCVIIGGPEVPNDSEGFLEQHADIDFLVHGEGEATLVELLRWLRDGGDIAQIAGISHRQDGRTMKTAARARMPVEHLPSPYLDGTMDGIVVNNPGITWHASQETHRGCPYSCTFCDWGSAVYTKTRALPTDRLMAEIDWFGQRRIDLVYNTDANYGMFARDLDLTRHMINTKSRMGHPRKFRAAYAKKSNDKVFAIAEMLNLAGMNKGITLSMQSMDSHVLDAIKRRNITTQDFVALVRRYRSADIATYTELILGLPGETLASFTAGMETLLVGGQHDTLVIYPCMLLRNSEMADAGYRTLHGLQAVRVPLTDNHRETSCDEIAEYHDIIVATNSMPHDDWRRAYMLGWMVQSLHCLGLTQLIAMDHWRVHGEYMKFYMDLMREHHGQDTLLGRQMRRMEGMLDSMLSGAQQLDQTDGRFGNVNWPPEELSFMQLALQADEFYQQLKPLLHRWMPESFADQIIDFQKKWIVKPAEPTVMQGHYSWNFPAVIEAALTQRRETLAEHDAVQVVFSSQSYEHAATWSQQCVWYGRKQALHKRRTHVVD